MRSPHSASPPPAVIGNGAQNVELVEYNDAANDQAYRRKQPHPLANIFPLIEGPEFDHLVTSIAANGLREEIVLYEDMILDGRNRARACEAAGVEPRYTALPHDVDPVTFVIDKNVRRRHLNESQRAFVGAKLANLDQGRPEKTAQICAISQQTAAARLNVSPRSVQYATAVQQKGIPELQGAVERGEISVSAAAKIARLQHDQQTAALQNGARAIMNSREEPNGCFDYFPTPPWATRALMECVLPRLGIRKIESIWEPACGEGHIAEVLREYAENVLATDIHDYGYDGAGLEDFLDTRPSDRWQWIITNPPFGDKTIEFVKTALDFAETGVAMFIRSQWVVEGIAPYEAIFRDHPPTLCAFFVEPVPLCKGRWEPESRTATAYCWLVWVKGMAPRALLWIAPGRRGELSKEDDRERFTAHPVIRKKRSATDTVSPAGSASDDLDIPTFLRRSV